MCHNSALRALLRPQFAPESCPMIALSVQTNEQIMPFAARCFQAPKLGLLLMPFSLGPPLAKSQKMADLGAFAKCVITRLCGHFCGRSLRQNLVR